MTHDQFEVLSNQAVARLRGRLLPGPAGPPGRVGRGAAPSPAGGRAGGRGRGGARRPPRRPARAAPSAPSSAVDVDTEQADRFARIGVVLTVVAAGVHLVAVVARGLAADPVRVPWGNMYEFTLTATLMVPLGYLLLHRRFSPRLARAGGHRLRAGHPDGRRAAALRARSSPLRDALQSPWLVIHVIAAIIATGAFTLGGMCSVLYLIKERWPNTREGGYLSRLPGLEGLDRMAYRTQAFAFPVWTFAALIAGPIWAQHAWGRCLGLGPQGGLGVHHLGRLRRLPARARDRRVEGSRRRDRSRWSAWRRCGSTSSGSTSSSAAAASTPTRERRSVSHRL